ncbi:MAG: SurA N-terminal domain-containing protein [Cytophagales bacterium]|nr:SurA N-terminal domain-containing protein [Cytophagales bacterium]
MGIITKIRERAGWVVGLIAISLLFFLLGGDLLSPNSILLGRDDGKVGEINGKDISLDIYRGVVERLNYNYRLNYNKPPDAEASYYLREQAWQELIRTYAYQDQYEVLGLTITDEELVDMVQGNNVAESVKQAFKKEEDQSFDKEALKGFLEKLSEASPERQAIWHLFEKSLKENRYLEKYKSLFSHSHYVTEAEAQRKHQTLHEKRDISYLFIPFSAFPDSLYIPSEKEGKDYLENNAPKYQEKRYRNALYINFPIVPSSQDSLDLRENMISLKEEFARTKNDSLFALGRTEGKDSYKRYTLKDLPDNLSSSYNNLSKGSLWGPFEKDDHSILYKISGVEEGKEAYLRAKHILFKPDKEGGEASRKKAKKEALGILKKLKRGADFAKMAQLHGTDGTSSRGGDLGWFKKGQMVAPFEKAVFSVKRKGLIPNLVETDFGYHIVSVTELPQTKTYQIASILVQFLAGEETRSGVYQKAAAFSLRAQNIASFRTAAKEENLLIQEASRVFPNDRNLGALSEARTLVSWLYNQAEVGDVSEIFERENEFVLLCLENEQPKGLARWEMVKEEIEKELIKEKKVEDILSQLPRTGTLDDKIQPFLPHAQVYVTEGLSLEKTRLQNIDGKAHQAVGVAFALPEKGAFSEAVVVEEGVVLIQLDEIIPIVEEDVQKQREALQKQKKEAEPSLVSKAVEDKAEIEDKRYRFF